MRYPQIVNSDRLFFTSSDVAESLGIRQESAVVLCNRYVKAGLMIRMKRDLYILKERWRYLKPAEILLIANRLQIPSCLSLTTALSFHRATTQIQPLYVESVAAKQGEYDVQGTLFRYFKIKQELFFGFDRRDGLFVASAEKALWDAVYLQSLGRYSLDAAALDLTKINKDDLDGMSFRFPDRTVRLMEKLWKV